MALLEVEGISLSFAGLRALEGVSFTVSEGQILGLIGPNGAGKSTMFNCISRIYQPDQGQIRFAGEDLLSLPVHQLARRGVARTFQNIELFPSLTVRENLLIGCHSHGGSGAVSSALRLPSQRREEAAMQAAVAETIQFLGLTDVANREVSDLALGTLKLVELGRALTMKPRLLLLDEPAAGMNGTETKRLSELVRQLRDQQGITVLLVEHDMSLVMEICDRIVVLDFGKKIGEGTPAEVQRNPAVIAAYLGEGDGLASD